MSGKRDLGSEQVNTPKTGPDRGHIPDPVDTGTAPPTTFAQPRIVGDNELEDMVLGSLHHEYPMGLKTVEQSATPRYRDQVEDVLNKLMADGFVIQDSQDRYMLNNVRKDAA